MTTIIFYENSVRYVPAMTKALRNYFLLCFALLLSFQRSSALRCYSCAVSIGRNEKCENLSFTGGGALPYYTCKFEDAVCAKYVIEYVDSVMMHRGCQHRDVCRVLASKHDGYQYSKLIECQSCSDGDFCNNAETVKTSLGLGLSLLAVSLIHSTY